MGRMVDKNRGLGWGIFFLLACGWCGFGGGGAAVCLMASRYDRTACSRSGGCESPVAAEVLCRDGIFHPQRCVVLKRTSLRHDAEVYTRSAAGPMTDVSNLVCAGFRALGEEVGPRAIGRRVGNQIDPGASPLCNIDVTLSRHCEATALLTLSLARVSRPGLYPRGMTSGAGIVISSSSGPAVEFSGSEFDSKVGRECGDPVP